jgi:hypothetical protein
LALLLGNVGVVDWDLMTNQVYIAPCLMTALGYSPQQAPTHIEDWVRPFIPTTFPN